MITRREFIQSMALGLMGVNLPSGTSCWQKQRSRPNILLCISDDQSWQHASAYGDPVVNTPNFDRIASEGIRFTHAFCAAPSCAPSRAALLTGQEIWRLEQGGLLNGALPQKFSIFTDRLAQAGYVVGYTGKGYSPANLNLLGCWQKPTGREYNAIRHQVPQGVSSIDYAASFEAFLKDRNPDQPFCFWYGALEPHRKYRDGVGVSSSNSLDAVAVPLFLPDAPVVRQDLLDYYFEIEWHDRQLGQMLQILQAHRLLDNTIIVVTSDNGMPFPRAKATLYDYGVRVPLAIRWGEKIKSGRIVDDFVSLTDLAPTFLDLAGLPIPGEMTGNSLKNIFLSATSGRIEPQRDRIFTAFERHTLCRPDGLGYPRRAIRTFDWLYIRNYKPDRWPAGDPDFIGITGQPYGDVDGSPTKDFMIQHQNDPVVGTYFARSFGKLPDEELYDMHQDPYQLNNLAGMPELVPILKQLQRQLEDYQQKTLDPRLKNESPWDHYPYYGKRQK
jgi:uncharacterized sulfatase